MYKLYYNLKCEDCKRQAEITSKFDWFKRISLSTEPSPIGIPEAGEIVVVNEKNSQLFTGGYALRKVCMNVPLFIPYGILLYLPPILKLVSKNKVGCNGDACDV